MGMDEPTLDQRVGGGQVGGDDAVKTAAAPGTVIVLQAGGLLAENEIVGDGTPQLTVGKGLLLLLGDQTLGLHRVLHVEGHVLHQGQQSQLGILIAEGLQGIGGILDDGLFLSHIGMDDHGHVRKGQQLGVLGQRAQGDMAHQPLGPQAVFAVQHRHQKITGGDVAPHQNISVSGVDDVDGRLGNVVSGRGIHHGVGFLLQTELLQHRHGAGAVAHQHRLHKALLLGGEDALEHVLTVRTGQDHPHGAGHLRDALQDRVKVFQFHSVISDSLSDSPQGRDSGYNSVYRISRAKTRRKEAEAGVKMKE